MNRFIPVLGAATLSFGMACAYMVNELNIQRERNRELNSRIDALESELARPTPFISEPSSATLQIAAATADQPVLEKPAIAQRPPPVSNPALQPDSNANAPAALFANFDATLRQQQVLMADPEYRAAMLDQQKMSLLQSHPDLAAVFGAEQADKLTDVMAQHQVTSMQDGGFIPRGQNTDPEQVEKWRERILQQQRERDAEIAAVLGGDAGMKKWQEYQQSMGARYQVRELRSVLENSGVPLRGDQVESLVSVIAQEQQRIRNDALRNPPQPLFPAQVASVNQIEMYEQSIERAEQQRQRTRDAASAYLTGEQLQRFDQLLNQQVQMQRASMTMAKARAAAQARGEIPPSAPAVFESFSPAAGMVGSFVFDSVQSADTPETVLTPAGVAVGSAPSDTTTKDR